MDLYYKITLLLTNIWVIFSLVMNKPNEIYWLYLNPKTKNFKKLTIGKLRQGIKTWGSLVVKMRGFFLVVVLFISVLIAVITPGPIDPVTV